jgi:hypothetical protein
MFCFLNQYTQKITLNAPENVAVLAVAVSEYPNPTWNLNGPINDIQDWINFFRFRKNVPIPNIFTLYNELATTQNILQKIKQIYQKGFKILVFLFSGHGTTAVDVDEEDLQAEILVTHDFPNCILYDYMLVNALSIFKDVYAVVDACHSQGTTSEKAISPQFALVKSVPNIITNLKSIPKSKPKTIYSFTACLSHQKAYESPRKNRWNGDFSREALDLLNQFPNYSPNQILPKLSSKLKKQTPFHSHPNNKPLFPF